MSVAKLFYFLLVIKYVTAEECGNVKYSSGLIFGGTYAKQGQWPWLCTLHDTTSDEFFCGSTLISSRHVLTGEL